MALCLLLRYLLSRKKKNKQFVFLPVICLIMSSEKTYLQEHLIESFLEMMSAERDAAKNTIEAYQRDLEDFASFLAKRKKHMLNANREIIISYLSQLENAWLARSSVARRLSAIKQFYQFLLLEGIVKENPTRIISAPKIARNLPKVLSVQEVDDLLKTAQNEATKPFESDKKYMQAQRLNLLLELLYATGMRVSELVSLKRQAVMRDSYFINIIGKGGRERIVPLNDGARDALFAWLHNDKIWLNDEKVTKSVFLFPSKAKSGHIERQVFARELKALAVRAGISANRVSPHILRHAFASHLLQGGANLRVVQTLLGHADISTTQIYTHVLDERLRELVAKHPLAKTKL